MGGYFEDQTESRRFPHAEAGAIALASESRRAALLALIAAAAALMCIPAFVAVLSVVDSNLLDNARDWAARVLGWLSSPARVLLSVPMLATVAGARENP